MRKHDSYQRGEFADVTKNQALGRPAPEARPIADKFLADALLVVRWRIDRFPEFRATAE
jgi:hypothetical protein